MKKLKEFSDNEVFYRGTIIVLKDKHISPAGNFDIKYAMIGGCGANFEMLDLYRSIGDVILHNIAPNVNGHFGVNKQGIYDWNILNFSIPKKVKIQIFQIYGISHILKIYQTTLHKLIEIYL